MCVYFERSYELCYRRADHSLNRIIPPPCPVIQHYNSITQETGPMAVRKQLVRRKEGTEIVRGQLYTLLPNIGPECVITTIRASLPYHWVHQQLTMEHN